MDMSFWLVLMTGLVCGTGMGWLWAGRRLSAALASAQTELRLLSGQNQQLREEYNALDTRFAREFEAVAHRVILQGTERLQTESREKLESLLNPLREKLTDFQRQMQTGMEGQVRDSERLYAMVSQLSELNKTVSAETSRLTSALKGESPVRGAWGEMILSRLLEVSGLEKDTHYSLQKTFQGGKIRPDVVLNLPEEKFIIIDSKVSLVDYERIYAAADENTRNSARKAHVQSMRRHIDDLSGKDYPRSSGIDALELTFMFVPIEPAFTEAMQVDPSLYEYAFAKGVVILTPGTLLTTLRLVEMMWRRQKQEENALKIAEAGGALYDKFCGFAEDMNKLGSSLESASKMYTAAMNKLTTGQGNLTSRAEKLRTLGAKATKKLSLTSEAEGDDQPEAPEQGSSG